MYWCKPFIKNIKLLGSVLLCASGLAACRPDVHEVDGSKKFFDLKGFVNSDAAKLNKAHTAVSKSVKHNDSDLQTKQIATINWEQELGPFAGSDINKPAWRDGYSIEQKADSVIYTATQPQLVTRRIMIQSLKGQVKKIVISNATQNLLYNNTEKLVYYPDSLYLIDKVQKVKLMGENRYLIRGEIKN